MYAITGITGQVGGALARNLLADRLPVRAVLRDEAKAAAWRDRGCEVALAEMEDAASLTAAFKGAAGVFILPPSEFDPEPGFPEAKRIITAVRSALAEARPGKVVCLSTIGADVPQENLLTQRTLMEEALREIGLPVTFLRPGWFMENALWDIPSARERRAAQLPAAADKPFPMVATQDIGRVWPRRCSAKTGVARGSSNWKGPRGYRRRSRPRLRRSPGAPCPRRNGAARDLGAVFRAQGMRDPLPRIRMLDGFNEGWIEFSEHGRSARKGTTALESVIAELVKASEAKALA